MDASSRDLEEIYMRVKPFWRLHGSRVLVTGAAGFLGYYYSKFLISYFDELALDSLDLADIGDLAARFGDSPRSGVGYIRGDLSDSSGFPFDPSSYDVIVNLASFASPVAYRANPKGTLKGSVLPVWSLLEGYSKRPNSSQGSFQIFSSSEIYGDPPPEQIPTSESYRGNVSCIGPRACYDESKRFIETIGSVFSAVDGLNISVVRPFNNFGPGMSLRDGRLPADVIKAVLNGEKLSIFSDGKPTRSFCYVVDALVGYLLALNQTGFTVFNIGNDTEEISVREFVERAATVCLQETGAPLAYEFTKSDDKNYLVDNPNRRFPDLTKARDELQFVPEVSLDEGLRRWVRFEAQESQRR